MVEHTFARFQLKPFIQKAIAQLGFTEPTEIQKKLIPIIMTGKSAIGQSQTGTGKTHAFLLPIINKIKPDLHEVQAVITTPTRELAQQIYKEIRTINQYASEDEKLKVRCIIGGTDKQRSISKLKTPPQIVVGTPGRMNKLIKEQALFIHKASILVIDEADLMFDMGFIHDLDQVASKMPTDLQMLVFSATIPEKLKPFLKKYMEHPVYEQVQPQRITAKNIDHVLVPLKSRDKISLLQDILISYNPYLAIVFTNTKAMANTVADKLSENGLKVGRLHGDLSPRERKKMMRQIRQLDYQYVVATDLAARGIDIEGVSHIINYELPRDLDFYVHRSGRTGRANLSGIAATIYEPSDEHAVHQLEKMGITFRHVDIRKGEWIELSDRNRRKKRFPRKDGKTRSTVKKPKKIKPGYKQKMKIKQAKQHNRKKQKRK